MEIKIIIENQTEKKKKIDGFGIFKGAPKFEEDEESHREFW